MPIWQDSENEEPESEGEGEEEEDLEEFMDEDL